MASAEAVVSTFERGKLWKVWKERKRGNGVPFQRSSPFSKDPFFSSSIIREGKSGLDKWTNEGTLEKKTSRPCESGLSEEQNRQRRETAERKRANRCTGTVSESNRQQTGQVCDWFDGSRNNLSISAICFYTGNPAILSNAAPHWFPSAQDSHSPHDHYTHHRQIKEWWAS